MNELNERERTLLQSLAGVSVATIGNATDRQLNTWNLEVVDFLCYSGTGTNEQRKQVSRQGALVMDEMKKRRMR